MTIELTTDAATVFALFGHLEIGEAFRLPEDNPNHLRICTGARTHLNFCDGCQAAFELSPINPPASVRRVDIISIVAKDKDMESL